MDHSDISPTVRRHPEQKPSVKRHSPTHGDRGRGGVAVWISATSKRGFIVMLSKQILFKLKNQRHRQTHQNKP